MVMTQQIKVAYLEGLNAVPIRHGDEEASQTYLKGQVLIQDNTSGEVKEASTEPVDDIQGIALRDASGTAGTDVPYVAAIPGVIFSGHIGTSTTAGDSAATDINAEYPLALSSSQWFVDKTDNTNPCVRVVGFKDDVGTTNGIVYFEFMNSKTSRND